MRRYPPLLATATAGAMVMGVTPAYAQSYGVEADDCARAAAAGPASRDGSHSDTPRPDPRDGSIAGSRKP